MAKFDVNLANFNCTFKLSENVLPMLKFFEKLIYPAVTNEEYVRKSRDSEYYLTEVELVNLSDSEEEPEYALIGKHVKRHLVTIKNDFKVGKGFIPVGETKHSAPFSVFILLLKNHRIIHFKDQRESPTLNALGTTIKVFTNFYRYELIQKIVTENGSEYLKHRSKLVDKNGRREINKYFKEEVYPEPDINIVPIPSDHLIEEQMKHIKKIQSLSFRVFPLNHEIDTNEFLSAVRQITENFETPSGQVNFNSPKNIPAVTKVLKESDGLADFTVKAVTDQGQITLKPEEFSESIPVRVEEEPQTFVGLVKQIFSRLIGRRELATVSDENEREYRHFVERRE